MREASLTQIFFHCIANGRQRVLDFVRKHGHECLTDMMWFRCKRATLWVVGGRVESGYDACRINHNTFDAIHCLPAFELRFRKHCIKH